MALQRRHESTDDQWQRLAPLLPPQHPRTGRPANDHRTVLNGILWILRTGALWRDLPERYGSWQTVYSRVRRWQDAGVWNRVLTTLQADTDGIDSSLVMIDGTNVRAHHQAAGARKKGARTPNPVNRRGRSAR
jgi:transposase